MPPQQTHSTRHYLRWLGLLAALIIGYAALRIVFPPLSPRMSTQATMQEFVIPNAPQPTAGDYVSAQKGFQYIVSYSDTGFSPTAFSIKKGETVRFVNNASSVLNLTIGTGEARALVRGAYVQYTAEQTGGIPYSDHTISGTLMVTE